MTLSPHEQPVLILGAKSDIARALAHTYAKAGHPLYLAARHSEQLIPDLSDISVRYNVSAKAVEFDALNVDSHQSFLDELLPAPFGVICVVGYLGEQEVAQRDFSEAKRIIDTNFTGLVSVLNLIANHFEQRGSGFIVGVSSVAGDRGRQSNYLYGSAKAALSAYLSGLRNRLNAAGVQVLTVKPGFVQTKMTESMALPKALTADPEQVAADILRAQRRGRNVLYTRWYWQPIMATIKSIPEFIFKRMKL